jgi:3-methyladenine DNA glycosylase AlkD
MALMILVAQFRKCKDEKIRKQMVDFYLKNRKFINNWDLVDGSARQVLGDWLMDKDRAILYKYAVSKDLWERRIAIIATFRFIMEKDFADTLKICEILMEDRHDLIHKATGWMLREIGKRDPKPLRGFLDKYSKKMPRTMLRYAIEHLTPELKKKYMSR